MNLKSLRQQIKNHTDYSPDLQNYNDQLDDIINDAYLNIWTYKRWNFAQKEAYLKFYPDMLPEREAATTVTINVTKGSRQVLFSAAMERLAVPVWEGQVIEIQGYEYTISKVVSSLQLLLDIPFIGTSDINDATWKVKKRYYDLPEDCIELLSLAHADVPVAGSGQPAWGKLIPFLARREEDWNLRKDYSASYADGFIWSAPLVVPAAEKTTVSNVTVRSTSTSDGIPALTTMEVCWCFEKDGRRGPLSEPATVTIPGKQGDTYTFDINFITWDDQAVASDSFQSLDGQPSQWEGYKKVVFWNSNYDRTNATRHGLPCWVEFTTGGPAAGRNSANFLDTLIVADTDSSVTIEWFSQMDAGNRRYREYDGQHLRIRPYPRIDGWDIAVSSESPGGITRDTKKDYIRQGLMRYFYKPEALTKATDSPDMPYEFHQLIVYQALQDVYLKSGNASMSEVYRKRIDDEIKDLSKRYLDRIDTLIRRQQFGINSSNRLYDYNSLRKLN